MSERRLDKWSSKYASRTSRIKSSEIRDLLAVTARPDIISLAGGLPDTESFRMEKITEATREVMNREGAAALQYGPSEGHEGLKKHIVDLMAEEKIKVDTEDFIITNGAQQALDLIGKIFIDVGSKALVGAPSYVGALNAFAAYEGDMVGVPLDDEGLQVDILEKTLADLKSKNEDPRFIYLVPNFHNPAGVTLSLKRRRKLLRLAKEYELLVVEDNPYGRLRYEGKGLPSLRSLDDSVIYLGTFSKIFSPGLRLGWVIAPYPILEKIIFAKQGADLCTSSFSQRVVESYFAHNLWKNHVGNLVKTYRRRRNAMLEALKEFFPPEAKWTKPQGGLFIWATLPKHIDTTEMLAEAISQKVAYVPGRAFYADGSGANKMRLCFSYPKEEAIYEGIKRLAKVVKQRIALYESLTRGLKL